ncbi:MAG: deoxyribodipyrimidine photo-lyase [Gammaproteobacteria bacterium]
MKGIVWFREDLRIYDNTALQAAAHQCTDGVMGVYIIDPSMWRKHHIAACRIEFILRGLKLLSQDLNDLNIPLLILKVENTHDIPKELLKISEKNQAKTLFYNRQYEANESQRDQLVENDLRKHQITCYSFDDQVILPPGSVKTQTGEPYSVFTPYKKAWKRAFTQSSIMLPKRIKPQKLIDIKADSIPDIVDGFKSSIDPALWPAGERSAELRLRAFIENQLFLYDKQRDFPSLTGTSQLSPYLSTGMISPRLCFMEALTANQQELDSGNSGALTWMSELIWREFYKHLLVAVPRLSKSKPYQLNTEKIKWCYDEKLLKAWQEGKTGYPIIDAAMRQLNTTGWMHNRLRMVVAMYFTKNMFFDWRIGEDYFISHLIDGDLAANNGGWQWCASTGTDAAPYFRVFNPISQSERFDPEGKFIRQYCPELNALDDKSIHDPYARASLMVSRMDYPTPLINLKSSRTRAIEIFKTLNN